MPGLNAGFRTPAPACGSATARGAAAVAVPLATIPACAATGAGGGEGGGADDGGAVGGGAVGGGAAGGGAVGGGAAGAAAIGESPRRCRFSADSDPAAAGGRELDRSIIPVAADCRSSWDGGVPGTAADSTAAGAEASACWRLGHIGEPLPAGTALFGVSTLRADALPPAGDVGTTDAAVDAPIWRRAHIGEPLTAGNALFGVSTLRTEPQPAGDELLGLMDCAGVPQVEAAAGAGETGRWPRPLEWAVGPCAASL